MTAKTAVATPDPEDRPDLSPVFRTPETIRRKPRRRAAQRDDKDKPKLRDGVMKRGKTWSYVIRVTGSATFLEGKRIEGTTKGGRSRIVSIDQETAKILKAHKTRQAEDQLKAGEEWKGGGHVFLTGWGDPIHPDTSSSLMAKLINKHNEAHPNAKLPRARLHDLRHVHATTLLMAGVPVHVVAARLGHADPAITLRVYAHVINAQLAEAAEIFAKQIDPPAA